MPPVNCRVSHLQNTIRLIQADDFLPWRDVGFGEPLCPDTQRYWTAVIGDTCRRILGGAAGDVDSVPPSDTVNK